MPLFRSPSARLVQHDKLLLDDAYRGNDGSIIGTLGGLNNKEVHHYTFQPSKQIVSKTKKTKKWLKKKNDWKKKIIMTLTYLRGGWKP